jgi:uncharacterized protein HemY
VLLGAGGALWGTVDHYLGLLSMTANDVRAAERHLRRALDQASAAGARPWAAHAEAALARALGELGDPRAEGHREHAAGLARELGLARLVEELEAQTPPARATTPSSP